MQNIIYLFIIYLIKLISCICDCEIKKNCRNKSFNTIFKFENHRDNNKPSSKHCMHCHNYNSPTSDNEEEDDKQSISDLSQFCDFTKFKQKNNLTDFYPQHQCDVKNIEIILFNIFKSISDIIKNKIFIIDDKIITNLINKDEKLLYQIKSESDKISKLIETEILKNKLNLYDNIKDVLLENMHNLHQDSKKIFNDFQDVYLIKFKDLKSLSDEDILEKIKSTDSLTDINFNKIYIQNLESLFKKNNLNLLDLIKTEINNTSNFLISDIYNILIDLNNNLKSDISNNKKQLKKNINTFNEKFFTETFENLNNLFNISLFNSMLVVNNVIESITKNKSI